MNDVVLRPSEFVALVNQTFEFALPYVVIEGEVLNFRISKNRWVYFDLKDEQSSVKCFGTVYQLPGPIEDGMLMKVAGNPRLHNQFGFSHNVQSMMPSGEGSIKKAAALLEVKLQKEGLFDSERKRQLPFPPKKIGLIASGESAAYADFMKILNARWQGVEVQHKDVQVQGEAAPAQIKNAIELFNGRAEEVDVLVIIRGGGSPDDLAAFSTEQVTRAVAGSRIPTMVAIGHEVDLSLAELAADNRASTPSNAAELLVPDRSEQLVYIKDLKKQLDQSISRSIYNAKEQSKDLKRSLIEQMKNVVQRARVQFNHQTRLLHAYSPEEILKRGFSVVRYEDKVIKSTKQVKNNIKLNVQVTDGDFDVTVKGV